MSCRCENCNSVIHGFNGKMVMLEDSLWKVVANNNLGLALCDTCIVLRLGRKITVKDLKVKIDGGPISVNQLFARINKLEY